MAISKYPDGTTKSWYIDHNGVRTNYAEYPAALSAFEAISEGKAYLCRSTGTLIACKG